MGTQAAPMWHGLKLRLVSLTVKVTNIICVMFWIGYAVAGLLVRQGPEAGSHASVTV